MERWREGKERRFEGVEEGRKKWDVKEEGGDHGNGRKVSMERTSNAHYTVNMHLFKFAVQKYQHILYTHNMTC